MFALQTVIGAILDPVIGVAAGGTKNVRKKVASPYKSRACVVL